MTLTPGQYGALKSLGISLLLSLLTWASVSANVTPLLGVGGAALVAMIAGGIEEILRNKNTTGKAMFGAVTVKPRTQE